VAALGAAGGVMGAHQEWFVARNGRSTGPLAFEDLVDAVGSGQLNRADLVWRDGMEGWVQASTIEGLWDTFPSVTDPIVPAARSRPAPLGPLFLAPIITVIYYLAVKNALWLSLFSTTAGGDFGQFNIWGAWGTHWFYRLASEVASLGFGTFIASGLARGRETAAAMVGGAIISIFYLWRILMVLLGHMYFDQEGYSVEQPLSQYVVDGFVIVAAPLIGAGVSVAALIVHNEKPVGFGGINRWHFLWLWIAAFFYTGGLTGPVLHFLFGEGAWSSSRITNILHTIVFGFPVLAVCIPLIWGLSLLSGHSGQRMSFGLRNIMGTVVLVVGFVIGVGVLVIWPKLATALLS
jgi:hypothetical protein